MKADWIAVDWGTSNLRIWAMGADGTVHDEKRSDQGMGRLSCADAEGVLLSHIEPWLGDSLTPVIACGMVGSREGWAEAPYDHTPAMPARKHVRVETNDPRLDVRIISGICQLDPADVMRGEETQILGFLSNNPDFSGVICLPGTHSKWVQINGGQVTQFQTIMTGELFALLTNQSVLRHTNGEWSNDCFLDEMQATFEAPERLGTSLFGTRAQFLLAGDKCGAARVSGTLIGAELRATETMWRDSQVAIIGANDLAMLYQSALAQLGVSAQMHRGSGLVLDGLRKIYSEVMANA